MSSSAALKIVEGHVVPTFGSVDDLIKLCKLGRLNEALQAVEFMGQQGFPGISRDVIYSLLQSCNQKKDLVAVRRVHSLMVNNRLDRISVLGDHLIRLFASCGSLLEANKAFRKVLNPSIFTWNAIISAHAKLGAGKKALELYHEMQQRGIEPDKFTISCVLKVCGSIGAIGEGMLIHDRMMKRGLTPDLAVGNALIDMFCKCGNLDAACKVFDELPQQSVVTWGTVIAGYAHHGHNLAAFQLYKRMQCEGIHPDRFIYSSMLKVCSRICAIDQGRLIHEQIIKSKLESDVVMGNNLIDMYMKCGTLEDGCKAFHEIHNRDVVSWGTMMSGYVQNGHGFFALKLYKTMQQVDIKPDKVIFLCALKACVSTGDIGQGRLIHQEIIRNDCEPDVSIGTTLIDMYAKCECVQDAHRVFNELPCRNVVTWDAMITGYVVNGHGGLALLLFGKLLKEGLKPGKVTYLCTLKGCDSAETINQGRLIHCQIVRSAFESDVAIGSALITMYAKCANVEEAQKVFYGLPNQDVVSWSAMIAAYADNGHSVLALELFEKMNQEDAKPSEVTYLCILKGCGNVGAIVAGRLIHEQITRNNMESDLMVGNTLVGMYAKCQNLEEARQIFDRLSNRDAASWGAMIAGYAQHRHGLAALELFDKMQQEGIIQTKHIFSGMLKACASIGAIRQGRIIHDQISRGGLESNVIIMNALLDMYAKCGSFGEAQKVFDEFPKHDVVSWGAIIAGSAQYGNCSVTEQCLEDMRSGGILPNNAIFISILAACSHAGLLEEGCQYFRSMREDHCIPLGIEVYSCMVDLLGRTGCLNEAKDLVLTVPIQPHIIMWTSLLTSCRTHGNIELGRQSFDHVVQLNPKEASGYILMSDSYAEAQIWEAVDRINDLTKLTSAWKKPGTAWIEVNNNSYEFVVHNNIQQQSCEIFSKAQRVRLLMQQAGYVPELGVILDPD